MSSSRQQSHQMVHEALLKVLGKASRAELKAIIDAIDAELDQPLRMRASTTADSKLVITASTTTAADGGTKTAPSLDDIYGSYVETTIDFQASSSWITGGTVLLNNGAFTMPTSSNVGYYRFMAAVYVPSSNSVNVTFGAEFSSLATMLSTLNPATVASSLDGIPMGYVILQSTASAKYKTANSATSIIENTKIVRPGVGGGAGGGTDKTYKISAFSATTATVKGGYLPLDNNIVLGSGATSTDAGVKADLTASLNTILTQSGLASVSTLTGSGAVILTLAIDLNTLSTSSVTLDNLRKVYLWGSTNLKLLTADPAVIDPRRYVWIDQIMLPTTQTDWSNATSYQKPQRVHGTLGGYFPYSENYNTQLASVTGLQTLTHNLSGEPQIVTAYYFDGTNKNAADVNVIVTKSATQIKVNADGYDITGGKYLEVQALYVPGTKLLAGASRTFTSAWFTSNATTTVPHGLNDRDDIRGYEVQEYNTTTGKVRNIDRSGLVVNFDDTNFTLNWTGLSPTSTLQYRVVAGGSPMPWAVPSDLGGFTKYVKKGPGSYATVVAALAASAAGDRICIYGSTSETANIVVPAGVELFQMPNTTVVITGTFNVQFSGAKGVWKGMNVQLNPAGTLASGINISAADCWIEGWVETNTAQTFTALLAVTAGGVRAKYEVGVKKTLGTITALEDNQGGTGGDPNIWGG